MGNPVAGAVSAAVGVWRREPAAVTAVVVAALDLVAVLGLPISPGQSAAVVAFTTALGGLLVRSQVSPVAARPAPASPAPEPLDR